MTTFFTIVTITYNSSKWVQEAVESVLTSEYSVFEYIICDDASTDDTWEKIKLYKDDRIRSFRHDRNIGEYQNRNFALDKAKGKYLLFVDGDDVLYRDALGRIANYLEHFPEVGSIWGVPDKYIKQNALPLLLNPQQSMSWFYLANIRIAEIGFAETIFNVEILKQLGGFSTSFISGDTHVKKLIALEANVLLVKPGFVFWRISSNQASSKLKLHYNGYRNNVLIDREIIKAINKKNLDIEIKVIQRNILI
ncbi:MAG: glycosyltransferase family 2 protein, partial [Flavobacterium sp.]